MGLFHIRAHGLISGATFGFAGEILLNSALSWHCLCPDQWGIASRLNRAGKSPLTVSYGDYVSSVGKKAHLPHFKKTINWAACEIPFEKTLYLQSVSLSSKVFLFSQNKMAAVLYLRYSLWLFCYCRRHFLPTIVFPQVYAFEKNPCATFAVIQKNGTVAVQCPPHNT